MKISTQLLAIGINTGIAGMRTMAYGASQMYQSVIPRRTLPRRFQSVSQLELVFVPSRSFLMTVQGERVVAMTVSMCGHRLNLIQPALPN